MKETASAQDWFLSVVSGRRQGIVASLSRGIFGAVEPIYVAIIGIRNFLYTRGLLKIRTARRPVVSIGNLTTGGTGKTPMAAWLVGQLRDAGRAPAVLLRGYKSSERGSDEELLLRQLIAPSPVEAGADRFAASERILRADPLVDVLILDDGLQHRRLARQFNLVIVDATAPFGFDHVLPRGLLREPLSAISRASAVVITRTEMVDAVTLSAIEKRIVAGKPGVPIFRCNLKQTKLLDAAGTSQPIDVVRRQRVFAFCGIGNPDAFFDQLTAAGCEIAGTQRFADHHPYVPAELSTILTQAQEARAQILLTTEKDWVKISPMADQLPAHPPIKRVALAVEFSDDGGGTLLELIVAAIRDADESLGWKNLK